MKKLLLGSVALIAIIAGPAMAADMPVKAPVLKAPPPVALYNWSGFYVGGQAGGAWGTVNWTHTNTGGIVEDFEQRDNAFVGVDGSPAD